MNPVATGKPAGPYPRILSWALALLLLVALACVGQAAWRGSLLDTGMSTLLPADDQASPAERLAEARAEQQLNQQMVLLVGASEADRAVAAARRLATLWQDSGLFAEVRAELLADMPALREQARRLQLASLPDEVFAQLRDDPVGYFMARAGDLANPFGQPSLLAVEDDWLGLGRHLLPRLSQDGQVQWDAASGTLQSHEGDTTWVWVHARLPEGSNLASTDTGLLPLLARTEEQAHAQAVRTLVAGGAIFSAEGRARGESESRWMGLTGTGLTLLLLLGLLRSPRGLVVLLPVGCGLLLGVAACLWLFGGIHVLVLVIGTSLVGVLIDLPMHWLAPALVQPGWRPWPAMREVLPPFCIGLLITVAGYLVLWLAPLPVLQQTALFSAVALPGACAVTALWLPSLFRGWQPPAGRRLADVLAGLQRALSRGLRWRPGWLLWAVLTAVGLWRSDWHDDIRQWVSVSPVWLQQAQAVGRLGGLPAGGRDVLLVAADDDALLTRSAALTQALQPLVRDGRLEGVQSLSQWVQPLARQQHGRALLQDLRSRPPLWAPLGALGVPDDTVRAAIDRVLALPPVSLPDSLAGPLAAAWQPLYLGRLDDGRVAGLVRVRGGHDQAALQQVLAAHPDARLVDRPGRLNAAFRAARDSAILLKLGSYGLAVLLLCAAFGWRRGLRVLAVPLASAVLTVAALGWLGIPLSLFAVFGLLLVSAIGVDYAVYAQGVVHAPAARLAGILLAALTSMMSFALLGASATPAVAGFGICVTLGIFLNLLLSSLLIDDTGVSHEQR